MASNWKNVVRGVTSGVMLLFVGGVAIHEGLPTDSQGLHPTYTDSAGITTACYGETKNITKRYYTTEECKSMLGTSAKDYASALSGLPPLPTVTYVGALDFTYNAGKSAFLNSQVRRCLLRSDTECASQAVLQWRFISKTKITSKDKGYGVWNWTGKKYTYDCSQLVKGKPNKLCTGLWERRKYQSLMLKGAMSPDEASALLQGWYK